MITYGKWSVIGVVIIYFVVMATLIPFYYTDFDWSMNWYSTYLSVTYLTLFVVLGAANVFLLI